MYAFVNSLKWDIWYNLQFDLDSKSNLWWTIPYVLFVPQNRPASVLRNLTTQYTSAEVVLLNLFPHHHQIRS
jgi:hypothetical protein